MREHACICAYSFIYFDLQKCRYIRLHAFVGILELRSCANALVGGLEGEVVWVLIWACRHCYVFWCLKKALWRGLTYHFAQDLIKEPAWQELD